MSSKHKYTDLLLKLLGDLNNSSLRKPLTVSSVGLFILKILSTGLNFLTALILARLLGAKGYRAYAYAIPLTGLINILVVFDLPMLSTREVSIYQAKSQWDLLRGFIRWTERFVF